MQVREPSGEVLAQITTDLVGLYHEFFGKGPTKAKTFYRDDVVICLLGGGRTTIEETLIESGYLDAVDEVRRTFQGVMEEPFKAAIAKATGRKVIAYISQIHPDFDQAAEVFVLEPRVP